MPKFEFEAEQWNGENTDEVVAWIRNNGGRSARYCAADPERQRSREIRFDAAYMPGGKSFAQVGDWIILGADGEFYTECGFSAGKFASKFTAATA